MKLFLLRHGETRWNVEGRKQGHGDSPLTSRGRDQARAIGRHLRQRIEFRTGREIVSSPLGRAMETSRIVCEEIGISPSAICADTQLMEGDHGDWQGLTHQEIDVRYPGELEARMRDRWTYKFPRGESYCDLAARASKWLASLPKTETLLVVTHEMMSRSIRGQYLGSSNEECLALRHPQDRFYILSGGSVEEHRVSVT